MGEAGIPDGIEPLAEVPGLSIRYPIATLGGCVVAADTAVAAALRHRPDVHSISYLGRADADPTLHLPHRHWDSAKDPLPYRNVAGALQPAFAQLNLTDPPPATDAPPVRVAVIDGGFYALGRHPYLAGIGERLIGQRDYVDGDDRTDEATVHGTRVLALLAAGATYRYRSAAHGCAEFLLLRTENVTTEQAAELYHLMGALEYAVAQDVRLIHLSLGYRPSDGPADRLHRARLARVLDWVSAQNVLLISSAGNAAERPVSVPADHPQVLAVGALDVIQNPAAFSSVGVRKPELAAPGVRLPVVNGYGGQLSALSGTSYSAPLVSALAIRLWYAHPAATAADLRAALLHGTGNADRFGLPDYRRAARFLAAHAQR